MTRLDDHSDSLDDLLASADWPEMSSATQDRLLASASSPPARRSWRIVPMAVAALLIGAISAAWWLSDDPAAVTEVVKHAPPVVMEKVEPEPATVIKPAPASRRLEGRPPRDWELALIHHSTTRPAEPERSPRQIVAAALASTESGPAIDALLRLHPRTRDELLLSALLEGDEVAGGLLASIGLPATRYRLLWEAEWYDESTESWQQRPLVVEAVALALPAEALLDAIRTADFADRDGAALAAIARSHDPTAGDALIEAARMLPDASRRAVADAPDNAAGVAALANVLDDPHIDRRREAAWLLSASDAPIVLAAVTRRIADPGKRREALLVLMWNDSAEARGRLASLAASDSAISATIRSLETTVMETTDDPELQI